jgi:hypothetical protein
MSGQWPPEWDDSGDDLPAEGDQFDPATAARLADVTAYLASVPAPDLPDSVEARISAALAAEAATRAAGAASAGDGTAGDQAPDSPAPDSAPHGSPAADPGIAGPGAAGSGAAGSRTLGPAPGRARVRRRRRLPRPGWVLGPLVACLLFAGLGWVVTHPSSSSSSSSAAAAAPAASAESSSAAAAGGAAPAAGSQHSAAEPQGSGTAPVNPEDSPVFTVTQSGTSYRKAALAAQVRVQLARGSAAAGPAVPAPVASSASAAAGSAAAGSSGVAATPTPQLLGCVLHLTGGTRPELVDQAVYQGTDAYVIATSSHVWVVGPGCTAANPELIASVPLAS